MKKRIILSLLLGLCSLYIYPQMKLVEDNYSNFGIFFNYNINQHIANFQKLPGIPNCCPKFESGTGSGITAGVLYDYNINSLLSAQARAGYTLLNGLLKTTEPEVISLNGTAVNGEFEHRLDSKLSLISIEPMISFQLLPFLRLRAGISAGFLSTKTYSQVEVITKPEGQVTFLDSLGNDTKKFTRNEYSGDIPNANSLQLGVIGSIAYELPLNSKRTLLIIPEITFRYGFTPIVKDLEWNINSLRAGISLAYSSAEWIPIEEEFLKPVKEIDLLAYISEIEIINNPNDIIYGAFDIKEERKAEEALGSTIICSIKGVGVSEGIEDEKAVLQVEEFLSTNMRPLLNYVFFDNNSAILPSRYKLINTEETKNFKIDNLNKETTLSTYYHILNIIGLRMKQYSDANITLIGCNSNTGQERGNKELSKQRAEQIKNYLTKTWEIEPQRIKVEYRDLPELPSNPREQDGIEENRRVEIITDKHEILEPVITDDTLVKASPPIIRFYTSVKSESEIKSWKINIEQNNKILKSFSSTDKLLATYDWNIDKEKFTIPKFSEPIVYSLEVIDINGNTKICKSGELPIQQITLRKKREESLGDKKIDHYSLILFKFGSSDLGANNERIADFIKSRLKSNSKILISGYTDRMGDDEQNLILSENRAKSLVKKLNTDKAYIRAMGEKELLYNNDLPEGRFYCRTVEVEVETPIKW